MVGLATLTACGTGAVAAPLPAGPATKAPAAPVTTTPASPSSTEKPSLTFAALGDIGSDSNASDVLTALGKAGTDLSIVVGDLSYGKVGQEAQWCDFVKERVGASYPFEVLSGNHDSNGKNGNINDFSACLPNQLPGLVGTYGRQYYVDVPQQHPLVRFVMISPGLVFPDGSYDYAKGGADYVWTENAIDSARADGIPWVVVGAHKPCLSMGRYGCESGPDVFSMLLDKKVDLVLHGHEHLYQRTDQLTEGVSGCSTLHPGSYDSRCVVDSDNRFSQGAGSVAATVGAGGRPLRAVFADDPETRYFAAATAKNQDPTHGFLKVTVDAKRLSAEFVGVNGSFTDSFTITR